MNIQYHNCDLLTLLDLLTEETKKYTRAIKEGVEEEIYRQGLTINTLIAEIRRRKKALNTPTDERK